MKRALKEIIIEARKRGYSDLKIIYCEIRKNIIILKSEYEKTTISEDWINIIGEKEKELITLNCSYNHSEPASYYIDLIEKNGNFSREKNELEKKEEVFEQESTKNCINQFVQRMDDINKSKSNIEQNAFSWIKYTKTIKRKLYYDITEKSSQYTLNNDEISIFLKKPSLINVCIYGNKVKDIMSMINSDYINHQFETIEYIAEKLNGKIVIRIMGIYQICNSLLFHFNSEAIINGASFFGVSDFINKKEIIDKKISILDVPQDKEFENCYLFDDEGEFTQSKYLIKDGHLNTCLGTRNLASQFDFVNGGNCYRDNDYYDYHTCTVSNTKVIVEGDIKNDNNYHIEIIGFQGGVFISPQLELTGNAIVHKKCENKWCIYPINMSIKSFFSNCEVVSQQKKYYNFISPELVLDLEKCEDE